ncbi:MAG: glycosyltransferase family 4 protein [Edaphobacter sp.]|uniref:glycosyltransferase family 4 protein n=1 Tax=Edaphobacter sp. TaxID=1934404 RepID=UPI0023A2074A|nr:glycosyltransferase family 4 protein [Edaphobacter sp.]MDE1178740.1 glycosyltransferase family 4 protein [Edaphobacter sp.]
MREVTVFVGGSVGVDPYSPRTWSGSSAYLMQAMKNAEILDSAVGIRVPMLVNYGLLAKNFNRNRGVWRKHFYFDPAYRHALTRAAKRVSVGSPVLMQIGHMFSLPVAFPEYPCVSYHDGNLAELVASGYGLEGVAAKRIDQAMAYERDTAQRMHTIFTFSEYLRQSFLRNYGVAEDRVLNIGGGINLPALPEVDEHKSYAEPRLLFIGTDFARKGGPQLLKAFAAVRERIPNATLEIVGPTHIEGLPAGATLHGHLSKADPAQAAKLEALFRAASLFVLPSLYEPFGIAPLEAMLYRLPAVLTGAWALREFVTPGENGELVEKGSVDDLTEKITTLLRNPEKLPAMGDKGRERVLLRYTWATVAGKIRRAVRTY